MARIDPNFGLPFDVEVELAGLRGDLFSMERAGWRIRTHHDPAMCCDTLDLRIGDFAVSHRVDSMSMLGRRTVPIRIPPDRVFGQVRRGPNTSELSKKVRDLEAALETEKARADAAEQNAMTRLTVADHLAAIIELQKEARPKRRREAAEVSDEAVEGPLRVVA